MIDLSGYDDGKLGSIRNPDGIWINSAVFKEEGNKFLKKGYYCPDPWGSPAWFDYWQEQRKRCIDGYSVGGVKITGDHYLYLNFLQIKLTEDPSNPKSRKIITFPDFWDGDYNYFWIRELAKEGIYSFIGDKDAIKDFRKIDQELQIQKAKEIFEGLQLAVQIEPKHLFGGWNIIVGKSRRKGYSYKSAAIAAKNYFTKPGSYTIFGAYEKKYLYPNGLFTMAKNNITFINDNTAWATPSDYIDKQDHIKASYKEVKNGIALEKGFKSEIQALTFKDNADAARGKDAEDIFFEESGAFGTPGLLKSSYAATQDCVMDGVVKTGMITIFGTSGDMEGGTADYADMFSRPQAFGLLPFKNIWDKDSLQQESGFFHPINWNLPGFYDEQGNSDFELAKKIELKARETLINNGATSSEIQKRMQEKPLGPSEAFAAVSANNFPVVEIKNQLHKIKVNKWQETKGTPVNLMFEGDGVVAKPVLNGKVEPITSYYNVPTNISGAVMIYEYPVYDAEKGLYKIGYDPIRQDQGTSLAAIIVYKGVHRGSMYHSIPVAEYVGRRDMAEDIDEIAEKLAILYNTTIMHENEVTGVKNYFRRIKKLDLLAAQPDSVISKNIKKSKVARVYGCHMNLQLKDAGERYAKSWLLTVLDHDENGDPVRVIDRIYSRRLLEELVSYNRKGNFDLISALFMCMFQVQEDTLGKEYGKKKENKNFKKLLGMIDNMYKK